MVWNKLTDQGYQPIPSLFTVEKNRLVLHRATPDAAGTYQVIVRSPYGEDRRELHINVTPRHSRQRGQSARAPQISFQQKQYEVGYGETVDVVPNIFVKKTILSYLNKFEISLIKFRVEVEQRKHGQKMVQLVYLTE